jgi:hypothetical protein
MRPTHFPETSVTNYRYSLRNNPEYRSSRLLRGGSQKYSKFSHHRNIPIFILISSRKINMGKTSGNGKLSKRSNDEPQGQHFLTTLTAAHLAERLTPE